MQAPETWILNGILYTQDPKRRVLRAHLRIVRGRIAAITRSKPSRIARGVRVVDAQGLTILPGFVQAHVHLCQTLFRNQADDLDLLDWLQKRIWKMEAAHNHSSLYTSALLGIHELLSSGTTCVLDMGTVRHTEAILEAVKKAGIRASVGKCLMDHPKTTPPSLRENTAAALKEACQLFDRWNGRENDRIRISFAPRFVVSCTEALMAGVERESRARGALVHTHASESLRELELVRKLVGCENIEYLHRLKLTSPRLVLAHCVWLKANEKKLLARTGTHVVHCPSSNMKLASGFAEIPALRKLGVNVALGADGAPCNNNLNMFQEMRLAALIHKPSSGPRSMRAREVLDLATLGGARALGWQADIGSIEVGKKADLIALDLGCLDNFLGPDQACDPDFVASSVVYSSSPKHLRTTWVDGQPLFNRGKVKGLSAGSLASSSKAALKRILATI